MKKPNNFVPVLFFIVDFILLNTSFFTMNYFKRGTLRLSTAYFNLLIIFNLTFLIVSFFSNNYKIKNYKNYINRIFLHAKSVIFITYIVSFVVVVTGLSLFSRLHIFGTCVMLFVLESLFFTIYFITGGKKWISYHKELDKFSIFKPKISKFLVITDFLLINFSFFMMNFYKRGSFILPAGYEKILFIIYGVWLVASSAVRKYDKHNFYNYYYALAACIKSAVLMTAMMSVVIFAFRLFYYSRLQVFGTFLFLILFEGLVYYLYFIFKFESNNEEDIETKKGVQDFFYQKSLPIKSRKYKQKVYSSPSFMRILIEKCLKSPTDIFEFFNNTVDLSNIEDSEAAIMSSQDILNVEVIKDRSLRLLVNLHKINNIRRLNRYFLEVHKKLINGGYFVGTAETICIYKRELFKKYPRYYAEGLYVLYFIFHRVFPKISKINKIYFTITKGKKRALSRAEILGRLYFCGFKVLAEKEIDNSLFFIAQKVKTPSLDQNPSYGPIVKLKRFGLNGDIINVYKFRTMYPYSEYLQDYIYQHHKLEEGGKIKDDFRITGWGKFMRKYWLDELPMIYNWIRGEIKFFGVRPLSAHYFDLYENQLREMRKKIKPGLIPPFYADLPRGFKEIIDSEKRYIQLYCSSPLRTQLVYFLKVLNNIIIKGARSS